MARSGEITSSRATCKAAIRLIAPPKIAQTTRNQVKRKLKYTGLECQAPTGLSRTKSVTPPGTPLGNVQLPLMTPVMMTSKLWA